MDIFKENKIYPIEGEKILKHFEKYYNFVFLAFQPFFRFEDYDKKYLSVQKSIQITPEQLKSKDELFKNLSNFNGKIFTNQNDDYPDDKVILENAQPVTWEYVKDGASFIDYSEIYKALKTSIGSYRKVFERPDLYQKLIDFTEKENIFHPTEGNFDVLSKVEIFNLLKSLGINEVVVIDEFYENSKSLDLGSLNVKGFAEKIEYQDYYIHSIDKSILFAIEWDSFFYLICSDNVKIEDLLKKSNIEGFIFTEALNHHWEWTEDEFLRLLEIENQSKNETFFDKIKNFFTDR